MRWDLLFDAMGGGFRGPTLVLNLQRIETYLRALLYTRSQFGRVSLIDTYGGCGRGVVGVRSIKLRWSYCWLLFRLLLILGLPLGMENLKV